MSGKDNYDIVWFESAELRERYCRIRIPGRPVIYVFPKDMTNTYALAAVRYGSCDTIFRPGGEEDFITAPDGVAHFLEHKMFTGEDGVDSFERFAALGADANAYTSHDRTVYLFNCTDSFDEALCELLHMVTHPYFTDETVKKEQGIIAQEIGMYDDDPEDVCYQNLLEGMYAAHPVRVKVCGTAGSISHITPKILYDCHGAFYSAPNMAVVVCGRADPVSVADIVSRETAFFVPPAISRFEYSEPAEIPRERTYVERQVSKPLFCIGIKDSNIPPDPAGRRERHLLLKILCRMIFASSSDLYNSLYDGGFLTSPLSYSHDYSENYSHVIITGASERPDEVYARVRGYIGELCAKPIDAAAFERCRRVVLSDIIGRYDSTEDIANSLVGCAFGELDIFEDGRVVLRLTSCEAGRLLSEFFGGDVFALSVVSPLGSEKNNEKKGTH